MRQGEHFANQNDAFNGLISFYLLYSGFTLDILQTLLLNMFALSFELNVEYYLVWPIGSYLPDSFAILNYNEYYLVWPIGSYLPDSFAILNDNEIAIFSLG